VRADIGIALDGDADRVIIIDERGKIVDGDQLLATIATSWHRDGRLAKPQIVATVMSNLGLERYLSGIGLDLARTKVGDRYVVERMRADGCNLGGEQSGHIILTDHTTTGDGLLASLELLSCVVTSGKPVSEVCHCFDPVPQLVRSVRYHGEAPLARSGVETAISNVERQLGTAGRLLVRPSGTEPVIRIMAEHDDPALVALAVEEVLAAIAQSP
jgi:phosphoglucosamine mutase